MSSWKDGMWINTSTEIGCSVCTRKAIHIRLDPDDGKPYCSMHFPNRERVLLFKPEGKYYTEEHWLIPDGAIIPYEMINSPDFRRIGGGAVLVDTQDPWGYPHLFPNETR